MVLCIAGGCCLGQLQLLCKEIVPITDPAEMQAYIRNNLCQRFLLNSGLEEHVQEISSMLLKHGCDTVLVNLSDNVLTLSSVQQLVRLLSERSCLTKILALDLSLNLKEASWKEVSVVLAALLKTGIVQS